MAKTAHLYLMIIVSALLLFAGEGSALRLHFIDPTPQDSHSIYTVLDSSAINFALNSSSYPVNITFSVKNQSNSTQFYYFNNTMSPASFSISLPYGLYTYYAYANNGTMIAYTQDRRINIFTFAPRIMNLSDYSYAIYNNTIITNSTFDKNMIVCIADFPGNLSQYVYNFTGTLEIYVYNSRNRLIFTSNQTAHKISAMASQFGLTGSNYTFYAKALDQYGNSITTPNHSFFVDIRAPEIINLNPKDNLSLSLMNNAPYKLLINGTFAEAETQVKLFLAVESSQASLNRIAEYLFNENSSFPVQFEIPAGISPGSYNLSLFTQDIYKNENKYLLGQLNITSAPAPPGGGGSSSGGSGGGSRPKKAVTNITNITLSNHTEILLNITNETIPNKTEEIIPAAEPEKKKSSALSSITGAAISFIEDKKSSIIIVLLIVIIILELYLRIIKPNKTKRRAG